MGSPPIEAEAGSVLLEPSSAAHPKRNCIGRFCTGVLTGRLCPRDHYDWRDPLRSHKKVVCRTSFPTSLRACPLRLLKFLSQPFFGNSIASFWFAAKGGKLTSLRILRRSMETPVCFACIMNQ